MDITGLPDSCDSCILFPKGRSLSSLLPLWNSVAQREALLHALRAPDRPWVPGMLTRLAGGTGVLLGYKHQEDVHRLVCASHLLKRNFHTENCSNQVTEALNTRKYKVPFHLAPI